MYEYTLEQWLLFFYFYCFCGWIWECCYVSVRLKKWVNRGFMHGPLLPIYGSGAIVVLFAALPVRDNVALIFLFGMIAATILEYFTGAAMEKIFHMRYWDYTGKPFNLNGHICLFCSIGWGLFSIALIKFVHNPIEHIVLNIPETITDIMAFAITVAAVVDFTQSFNAAMNLREMLEKATENNEKLKTLEKRMDVVAAVVDDDLQQIREAAAKRLHDIEEYVHNPKLKKFKKISERLHIARSVRILRANPTAMSKEFAQALQEIKEVIFK